MKFLKLALVAHSCVDRPAQAAVKPKVECRLTSLTKSAGILAIIPNGQTIHIKCMGIGSPTVILNCRLGGWAADWRKVHPVDGQEDHESTPGIGPASGSAEDDNHNVRIPPPIIDAALKVAHVGGPYVAVGHSLGGYESLLFKDHYPHSVVSMVLVVPSIPGQLHRFRKAVSGSVGNQFEKFHSGIAVNAQIGASPGSRPALSESSPRILKAASATPRIILQNCRRPLVR